ncbi:hypothetical protein [Desertivirga brevis]|uniref:hypothetical protein n=1 Tax=Desertivirga brevis TaxID=2810310 RepID=UPI001A95D098|nr:hypothetical protein [Pedobacter sp. SYSU D00873]
MDDKQFSQYDLIIKGKILKVDTDGMKKKITVKVINYFKGNRQSGPVIVSTPAESAACGISPKEGEKWLIFANGTDENYTTSMCTRSKAISSKAENYNKEEARDDVKFLKKKKSK